MSCFCRKRDTTSGPNVNDTPRSFSDHPVISLSGSDHNKSQRSPNFKRCYSLCHILTSAGKDVPTSGTSVGRITRRICSMEDKSGLKPPCIVNIFSSMMAAMGKQLKQSVNVFHSLMLYLRLPARTNSDGGGYGKFCNVHSS